MLFGRVFAAALAGLFASAIAACLLDAETGNIRDTAKSSTPDAGVGAGECGCAAGQTRSTGLGRCCRVRAGADCPASLATRDERDCDGGAFVTCVDRYEGCVW